MTRHRNDLTIYDSVADRWWSDDVRWVRTLKTMVPARLRYFDQFMDWPARACSIRDVQVGSWPKVWPCAEHK